MRKNIINDVKGSEITSEGIYKGRRSFIASLGALAAGPLFPAFADAKSSRLALPAFKKGVVDIKDDLTPWESASTYNNFYEFGTSKSDPAKKAFTLEPEPWSVEVVGEALKPREFGLDELLRLAPMEERIYRLRCVEGWSMVIPWIGFPLASLIKAVEPTGNAKFIQFESLHDPVQMPGQRTGVLHWPYVEGLRMDEAMHPLTLLSFGMYGKLLPNQNGAPVRLVVPWKYGFKSAKSIVRISLVERMPVSAWMRASPGEYGFYSNVNPKVDHPRWSQNKERRIGEFLKRETLAFNGYANQVEGLYRGMDLRKNF